MMLYVLGYKINVARLYIISISFFTLPQSYHLSELVTRTVHLHTFNKIFHAFSVQATLKGEEKTKPAARRQNPRSGEVFW